MSDQNDDRTVAFEHPGANKERGAHAGLVDVPKARLICTDPSQVESALPGEGIIHLTPGGEQTVGRGETCTYPIGSRKLSRQHARIFAGVGAWGVEDLNSTNGVRVNEEKIQTAWLKHGDVVRIGPIPFRFEVERPDMAAVAAAAASRPAAASSGDSDGEHTMMFSGSGGAKAAEVMIKAVREAEKEPAPTIVPTAPSKAALATQGAATKKGSSPLFAIIAVVIVVGAMIGGGVVYYPTFQKSQKIAAVMDAGTKVVKRVVNRSQDYSGTAPTDGAWQEDINALKPVVADAEAALNDVPDSRDLANLYAQSRFLVLEREFTNLFNRPEGGNEFLKEAGRKALELRFRLDKIAKTVPPQTAITEQEPLKTTADLADLAAILVSYRSFTRQFPQVGKPGADQRTPSLEDINKADARRKEFIEYSKTYHQILTRDYRLFNTAVQDVEGRDFSLISRWREALSSTK